MGAFNGSGVFVRSYSWTNDAANSIDITASRMDTEDTGFASGLSLCVTRDGQGQMAANFLPSADATYDLGSAGFHWRNLSLSGNATFVSASGNGLTITPLANSSGISITAPNTAGQSFGISIQAGTNANDYALKIFNAAGSTMLTVEGNGDTVGRGVAVCKFKAASTNRATNTTASADPDLQYVIPGAGTYAIEAWINDTGGTSNGGLKGAIAFSGSLGTGGGWGMIGSGSTTSNIPFVTINVTAQQMETAQGGVANMYITGCVVATSSGTVSFNWAQNSSNGTASIVGAGSWMKVTQLS